MSHSLWKSVEKIISVFLTLAVIMWSLGVGLLLSPGAALAAAPTRVGGLPPDQTNVPLEALVDIVFSEPINTNTVNATSTSLRANTGNVQNGAPSGSNLCTSLVVENNNTRVTCNHNSLTSNTWYTFRLDNLTSASTNQTTSPSIIDVQFQTANFAGGAAFSPPPLVTGTLPGQGAQFPANGKMRVYFSPGGNTPGVSTMATSGTGSVLSVNNIQLFATSNGAPTGSNLLACATPGSDCNMFFGNTDKELLITPGKIAPAGSSASTGGTALVAGTTYQLIIKNTVKNTDDIAMPGGDYIVNFTAAANDTTGPTFSFMFPADASTGADRATYDVSVGFNEGIDPATVNSSTVQLMADANSNDTADDAVLGSVQYKVDSDGRTVHVSPTALLTASKKHFIKVISGGSGVKDIVGNAMASTTSRAFTTGSNVNGVASDTTGPFVVFSEANNFEIGISYSEPLNATDAASSTKFTLESPEGVPLSLTGKTVEYQAFTKKTFIRGLTLPPNQSFKVTIATSTKDLAGNNFDATGSPAKNVAKGTVSNASSGGGPGPGGGQINFFDMGTEPIRVMPDSPQAGATSQYRGEFKAGTSIPSGGKIVLTFPSGFSFVADGGSSECKDKLDQFDNNDINGPATGTVTFTVACDSQAGTVTLTTSGGATVANDFLNFKIQGVVNSSIPKDFSTSGYTVGIKTLDTTGTLLESKTSMAFFLSTPGSQSISGFVFNDTDKDNTKDGGESGVNSIKVCLGGPSVGFNCTTTDGTGAYTFGSLNDGFYHVEIPPITSGSTIGGFMFRDVNLSSGSSQSNINFGLKASDGTINVTITSGPASEKLDVFAFNPYDPSQGGSTVREVTLDGAGAGTVALPVSLGKWQVGLGPWMPKTPGAPPPPPVFTFMPPAPQEVNLVSGAATGAVTFALQTSNRTIKGTVVDGSGSGIANVFVNARPATAGTQGGPNGAFTQTKSDGTFNLNVVNGTYLLEAHIPGMPSSAPTEATVKDNASGADSNSTADVYSDSVLATGAGITLKIAKSDKSISGRVLDESGNAIAFAFVNGEKLDSSGNFAGLFVGSPTDSSGNYTLYVSSGTWKLRAFAPGFGDLGVQTVTVGSSSVTDQNFQPTSGGFFTVSGTVYQDSNSNSSADAGEGISGAFVNIFGSAGGNGTVTSSDGTYSLKVKSGNDYKVEGFAPGKGPLAPTAAFNVTADVTGKNLSIAGTGTITVTITGINDAFVDARDASGRGFGTGSATAGVYTLTLPATSAGTAYTVKAQNPKYGVLGSQSVTLVKDGTQALSFTAPTLYAISGTISSASTACVSGVSVGLADATNGRHTSATADANGAYSIQVPNGNYSLIGNKPGCVDSSSPSTVVVNGAAVSTNTNRTMTAADSTISGRVTLSGTNATTKTVVFADNGSGKFVVADVETSVSGSSNNYTLNVTGGTWTVKARSDGFESASASVTVSSGGSASQNLALSAISGFTVQEAKPFNVKPSQGGLVKNTDIGSSFEVNIPAGVFGTSANDATVSTKQKTSVVDAPSDGVDVLADKGIEITPTDASGNKITTISSSAGASVTISIPYSESDIPSGVSESQLTLGVWSDEKQTWETLATTVDTVNNTLLASITHFSDFAPLAPVGGDAAPSTPTGLTADTPGLNSALIKWTVVSGTTGYNIYRDTSSSGSFPRVGSDPTINSGNTVNYTDSSLTCGTTYYYKIAAKNSVGESTASSAVNVTTLSCTGGGGGGGVSGGGGGGSTTPVSTTPTTSPTPTTPTTTPDTSSPATPSSQPSTPVSSPTPAKPLISAGLSVGSSGEGVVALQTLLESKGFLRMPRGVAKGYFGALTRQALITYQKSLKLKATGAVDAATSATMNEVQSVATPTPPTASSIPVGLSVASRGQGVVALQNFLESKGYLRMPRGVAKGYFGAATRQALRAYQKNMNLNVTGVVDAATSATIPAPGSSSSSIPAGLSVASRGAGVVALQNFLESKGFLRVPKGIAKGYFGSLTRQALMDYQKKMNLTATGTVDASTQAAMSQ